MWRRYVTIPTVRDAMRIENPAHLEKVEGESGKYMYHVTGQPSSESVCFQCHQTPRAGDYIVTENSHDIYHVPQDVFVNKYTEQK